MKFNCKLVNNEIIRESFIREGSTEEEVREGLELFCWPDGEWDIEEA